jgi:hypothetical protein
MAGRTTALIRTAGLSSGILSFALFGVAHLACERSDAALASDGDDLTEIPQTGPRSQKETGNCWLYATAAWAESLESSASQREGRPPATHYSVAYWDYWDWFDKITTGKIRGSDPAKLRGELDSGGSWGAASELILERGLVHESDFLSDTPLADATAVTRAVAIMATSLQSGALQAKAARTDGVLVRSELERAFHLDAHVAAQLSTVFGDDGKRTLLAGAVAAGSVIDPSAVHVLSPRPDGPAEVHALRDAIGTRRGAGRDPDKRQGPYAWSRVAFTLGAPSKTRAFLQRMQRAMRAGAPVPLDWFWASTADPSAHGVFHRVTQIPDDDATSVYHETLLYDYEVEVPGLGTLAAGVPATDADQAAALADDAYVVFLRVKDSYYGYRTGTDRHAGKSDLYLDYLLGAVESCSHDKTGAGLRSCHDIIPLDGAYLPPGF